MRWAASILASALAAAGAGQAKAAAEVQLEFFAASASDEYAVQEYREIWDRYGARIVAALESRTCLPFLEPRVGAIVAEATSNSGGPEHPMRLRASYFFESKKSTLVHELGHRHLWQLPARLDEVDGHRTLYLVLDLVWTDVWGEAFTEARVQGESAWRARYDYAAAWEWARSLTPMERSQVWNELLAMNGLPADCNSFRDESGRLQRRDEVDEHAGDR